MMIRVVGFKIRVPGSMLGLDTFEWTLEEVEVHNGPCPLVEHLSGRMSKS